MPKCICGLPVRKILYDAMPLYLDEAPLTKIGEFDAAVRNIRTFGVYGPNIIKRTAGEITQFPEPFGGIVMREHTCFEPVPPALTRRMNERYETDDPGF